MCVGFAFFVVTGVLSLWGWDHKIGDVAGIDALNWVLSDFPFGYEMLDWVPHPYSYLSNALFWTAVGCGLFAFRFGRKPMP